jgi:hypothetical protein
MSANYYFTLLVGNVNTFYLVGKMPFTEYTLTNKYLVILLQSGSGIERGSEMKKGLVIVLVLVLALGVFSMAACGGDSGLKGKYILTEAETGGIVLDSATLATAGLDGSYIEFTSGSKLTLNLFGESTDAGYKVSGNTVTIEEPDGSDAVEATLDGDTLVMEAEGVTFTFTKE